MNLITIVVIYFSCGILLLISVRIYFIYRRRRHQRTYGVEWGKFQLAKENMDLEKINYYGDRVIWNDKSEREHYEIVLQEVEKHIDENKEFVKLWKFVHYKVHGVEPEIKHTEI